MTPDNPYNLRRYPRYDNNPTHPDGEYMAYPEPVRKYLVWNGIRWELSKGGRMKFPEYGDNMSCDESSSGVQ